MDPVTIDFSDSFKRRMVNSSSGRLSKVGSWRRSLSLSRDGSVVSVDDVPDECIGQAGDIGHVASIEEGAGGMALEDSLSQASPLKDKQTKLPVLFDYLLYPIHLAVFGILGMLSRYLLKKVFGPGRVLGFTSNETALYPDLAANMVGSFLMGWFGVVFKEDARHVSEHLAVGLTTGYMGSLTTFSGWNQTMVELSSRHHWHSAVAGFLIGIFLVDRSIETGVWTAERLRSYLLRWLARDPEAGRIIPEEWRINSPRRHAVVMIVMLLMLGCLWGVSVPLATTHLKEDSHGAEVWLGCLVAPAGVWTRWYLAKLNGRGLGSKGHWKWLPVGTLVANVLAASMMAALATVEKAVGTKKGDIFVVGVELGFMGCLSTVSTFAVELYAMRWNNQGGRVLVYEAVTFIFSFAMGTLIYSVPVWTKHYN